MAIISHLVTAKTATSRRRHSVAGWVLLTMLAAASPARADVAPQWTITSLAHLSEIIVIGRVVEIRTGWDVDVQGIYTYVTVDVDQVIKGWLPERRITLKQAGGQVGSVGFEVRGQAAFQAGEQALLFLEVRPRDSTLYTAALWQGKWDLGQDAASGELTAVRHSGDLGHASADTRDLRPVRTLLAEIRKAIGDEAWRLWARQVRSRPVETPMGAAAVVEKNGFSLLGPARWDHVDAGQPVIVDAQNGGPRGIDNDGIPQMLAAMGLWTGAGSALRFAGGRFRKARCFNTFEGDNRVALSFDDPCEEIDDAGGVLAMGGGFFTAGLSKTVSGQRFHRFLQGGVVFNDSPLARSFLMRPGCFQDTTTHELGHTIGLGHSAATRSIMFPSIHNSCFQGSRGLGPEDVAGIKFIYPGMAKSATMTCALPGRPRNLTVLRSGTLLKASWDRPSSGGTVTSYIIEVGRSPGKTDVLKSDVGNVTRVSGTLARGTYYIRVRAKNGCGVSAPSNEVMIQVP